MHWSREWLQDHHICKASTKGSSLSSNRIKHVERANEIHAIETLMVTDELFR